jgi:SAM-dependent MidA family methyltransferase
MIDVLQRYCEVNLNPGLVGLVDYVNGIDDAGGCLPFDAFMEMALYQPGLGYYAGGLMPFGEQGDFITAPESGRLFGRCLARSVASVMHQLEQGVVLELGAGSGVLAADLLQELDRLDALPERYYILERSGAMCALQRATLSRQVPELARRVEWLEALPEKPLRGVVFGNEVCDAMPVQRFCWLDGEVTELGVRVSGSALSMCERSAGEALQAEVNRLAREYQWSGRYQSELCPVLPAWAQSLADCLASGLLLLIDYGYGQTEYYHPQRSMGTLMCHYRHHAHDDPLWFPGLQDITAFVDFTRLAEAVTDAGMQLEGYASQAQFLVACGIEQVMATFDSQDTQRFLQLSNEAKRLLLPGEMGERFKFIGFSRDLPAAVTGFSSQDLRSRL